MDSLTGRADDRGTGLTLSACLLLVALVYATLEHGAFDAGPFRVVGVLLAGTAVAHLAAGRRRPVRSHAVPLMAAMTFGALAVTVLATDADLRSAAPTIALAAMVLVTIAVVGRLGADALVRVVDVVIVCGLLASATAWAGVAFHREPWALVAQGIWRGSSTLTYANATGALAGVAFLLALSRLRAPASRGAALAASGLGVGLLASGSRAALLAVALGVVVLMARRRSTKASVPLAPVAVGSLVGAAGLVPSLSEGAPAHPAVAAAGLLLGALVTLVFLTDQPVRPRRPAVLVLAVLGTTVVVLVAGSALDALVASRLDAGSTDRGHEWSAAVDELATSPVVGVGPGRLDLSWDGEGGGTYVAAFVHNEYLELLATFGALGALALAGCAVVLLRRRPAGRADDGAVAALAAFAVHSGFDFLWHIPALALVGGVLVALVTVGRAPPTPSLTPEPARRLETTP